MIDDPLIFTKSERRVILLFVCSILLVTMIPWPKVDREPDWAAIESILSTYEQNSFTTDTLENNLNFFICQKHRIDKIKTEDWINLGAPKWLAERIEKYRSKGGKIATSEDLKKIYGINLAWLEKIDTCIQWRHSISNENQFKKQTTSPKRIEINSADTIDLKSLKGIGPVLSARIVKFRNALGGFHSIDQVGETYGLTDSVFQTIKPHLTLDNQHRRIFINSCTKSELVSHPYISYKEAGLIINFRRNNGMLKDTGDLYKLIALDSHRVSKMLPYLEFNLRDTVLR